MDNERDKLIWELNSFYNIIFKMNFGVFSISLIYLCPHVFIYFLYTFWQFCPLYILVKRAP